jgi:hypothetical protein
MIELNGFGVAIAVAIYAFLMWMFYSLDRRDNDDEA